MGRINHERIRIAVLINTQFPSVQFYSKEIYHGWILFVGFSQERKIFLQVKITQYVAFYCWQWLQFDAPGATFRKQAVRIQVHLQR